MQWLGQRLWDIRVSSEPSKECWLQLGSEGRAPEKNLEFNFSTIQWNLGGCGDDTFIVTSPQQSPCSAVRPCTAHPSSASWECHRQQLLRDKAQIMEYPH